MVYSICVGNLLRTYYALTSCIPVIRVNSPHCSSLSIRCFPWRRQCRLVPPGMTPEEQRSRQVQRLCLYLMNTINCPTIHTLSFTLRVTIQQFYPYSYPHRLQHSRKFYSPITHLYTSNSTKRNQFPLFFFIRIPIGSGFITHRTGSLTSNPGTFTDKHSYYC